METPSGRFPEKEEKGWRLSWDLWLGLACLKIANLQRSRGTNASGNQRVVWAHFVSGALISPHGTADPFQSWVGYPVLSREAIGAAGCSCW